MSQNTVAAFHGNISFNAHHSPMGAFFSFTCGHFGTRGGLGAQMTRPARQDIYIGVKHGVRTDDKPLYCLPFYENAGQADSAGQSPAVVAYRADQIKRHYGWATDKWVTPDFEFTIYTPFGEVPPLGHAFHDPAEPFPVLVQRYRLLPAVVATLTIDNSDGDSPKTGFFALRFDEPGVRVLDQGLESAVGFSWRDTMGVAGRLILQQDIHGEWFGDPFVFMRCTPEEGLNDADNPVHLLGNCPGIGFDVPAGETRTLHLVLGCCLPGIVTTRLEGKYWYTRHYTNLQAVLNRGFDYLEQLVDDANEKDQQLLNSGLSADQQFLLAHATRSYYGCTELLDVGGQPYWIVNEGEYGMINTLDLSVDHLFWELQYNPWVVRNLLDNFARYYSYQDQVKDPKTGEIHPGGISFCHDQGVMNQFSPLGHSSYELTNLAGCFSHMTQEQLCNWILLAASYMAKTNDLDWLAQNRHVLDACLSSMLRRDHHEPSKRNGIMSYNSSRCGRGQEITTYDSLDPSLAQARENLYMAVKCWASYLGLSLMYDMLGELCEEAENAARFAADSIAGYLLPDGYIPAVFEKNSPGQRSRILPAIEGLAYPLYWRSCEHGGDAPATMLDENGPYRALLDALKTHVTTLLNDPEGRNRFADGGWRLSSTAENSWLSKIAICQHVARELFDLEKGDAKQKQADAAHVKWLTEGRSAYWAMSDQFVNGQAAGSRYYPRGVTAVLWLRG